MGAISFLLKGGSEVDVVILDGWVFNMTTETDNEEYQNNATKTIRIYNNKNKSMKSLVQCDCIFFLKYYKNVYQLLCHGNLMYANLKFYDESCTVSRAVKI